MANGRMKCPYCNVHLKELDDYLESDSDGATHECVDIHCPQERWGGDKSIRWLIVEL